jgi:hypothetical protein
MDLPAASSISASASVNGMAEDIGEAPADGGLACAHEADQHDRAPAQSAPDHLDVLA